MAGSARTGTVSTSTATLRTAAAAVTGVSVTVVGLLVGLPRLAPLLGWDAAAVVYVGWTWLAVRRLDADTTARLAQRESPGRALADGLLLGASVASLAAVGSVLLKAGSAGGSEKVLLAGTGAISVALSWVVVHTVFTLRYARIFYADGSGGIDFNGSGSPTYADFAYLALTVGMTFQVSDTQLSSREIRSTVLRQALLSYLFGAVIVAVTINLVAGLGK